MIQRWEEEPIAVARKMSLRDVRFWDERMNLISHVQPVICRSLDHDITIRIQTHST